MTSSSSQPGRSVAAGTPPAAASGERISEVFAKRNYELLGELGRGGMGVVYLARDTKLGRKVALKTLSPERATRENSLRRFEREARTFAQIHHPHIAMLYEFEDAGPVQFLALEYIDGFDLESERRRGRIWEPDEAAPVIRDVAGALDYTHRKGILHRDIKPGNILIERGTARVVLTDFGLAKGRSDETLTAIGFAVGTPAYMAPEQISDQFGAKPDGRADIFSLGTVFYEMLTGEHPFLGADDLKTMRNVVSQEPAQMRSLSPDVPETLERIVLSMLAKHPDERIASARDVHDQLTKWIEGQKGSLIELNPDDTPKSRTSPRALPVRVAMNSPSPVPPVRAASSASPQSPAAPEPEQRRSISLSTTILIAVLVGIAMLIIGMLATSWLMNRG